MNISRREFLAATGAAAIASSYRVSADQSDFKIGYNAITWSGNGEQAINEISELGFTGIQLCEPEYRQYANRISEFKQLMATKKLVVVALSTASASRVTLKPDSEKQEIEAHLAMAKWTKEVGGLYLQTFDGARVTQGVNAPDDYRKLGKRLTEIGKRTFGEYGVRLGYHNQMNSLAERHDEFDRILGQSDPKFVWAIPDIGHIQAAGGDPVKFVREYTNRLLFPHFSDVIVYPGGPMNLSGKTPRPKYDFVELGQGKVNLPGVLQIMKDYRWTGWIIIELDNVRTGHTPKESAIISKKFIEEKLKLRV